MNWCGLDYRLPHFATRVFDVRTCESGRYFPGIFKINRREAKSLEEIHNRFDKERRKTVRIAETITASSNHFVRKRSKCNVYLSLKIQVPSLYFREFHKYVF